MLSRRLWSQQTGYVRVQFTYTDVRLNESLQSLALVGLMNTDTIFIFFSLTPAYFGYLRRYYGCVMCSKNHVLGLIQVNWEIGGLHVPTGQTCHKVLKLDLLDLVLIVEI